VLRTLPLALSLIASALLPVALPAQDAPAATPAPPDASAAPAPAAPRPTFHIERRQGEVHVDGNLDDAAWQGAPIFTLDYETYPADNVTAPVQTEVWITYDDSNLYVAARAHDPHPEQIRARMRDRDNAFQDDFVGLVFDTFNDERRAFEFFINPLGVQMDLSMNDVTGNEDSSWDTIWASAGRVTEGGYEVEAAIPFSSLRFPRTAGGAQTWGIDALRIFPRDQRTRIGLNPQVRGRNCYLCQESKLAGFEGITPGRNIELDPTVTANHDSFRADTSGPYTTDKNAEPGITARWGVTPGTTINATVNPDFSQVEADAAQLSVNTQFALFYPEKRSFFLEGADIFDTKIQAIYTRDIADPSWGGKVSGKEGKNAYGLIVARDTLTNLIFPASQRTALGSLEQENLSGILRYRRDLGIGAGSSAGAVVTSRDGTDYHNHVVGIDGLFRWGDEALRVEVLGSDTQYPLQTAIDFGQPTDTLNGTAIRAVYQHTTQSWMGLVKYNAVSQDFRADLGFIPQADYKTGYADIEKYYYSDEGKHWWTRFTLAAESTYTYDHLGNPLQRQISPYIWFNGPRQWYLNAYFGTGDSFYGGESFDRNFLQLYTEVQAFPSVFLQDETRIGQEIDVANARQGRIVRTIPGVRWDAGTHLRLNLTENFERLNVLGGQRLYTANVADLRATYQINVRTFVRISTQYFDVDRNPDLYTFPVASRSRDLADQLLFSYKLNPQTVLFLGYSDTFSGTELQGAPTVDQLAQTGRTFFFKVGYAWVM